MEFMRIDRIHYPQVVSIWEASVRATHDFLKEEDIHLIKPMLLNTFLEDIDVVGVKVEQLVGFYGNIRQKLEMLFVHPQYIRKGYGKALLLHAIEHHDILYVDVNEQNTGAIEFYKRMGFRETGWSPKDTMGKPFPLLHMERG